MRCCGLPLTLDKTLELFYSCTQLPIAAITKESGVRGCPGCPSPPLLGELERGNLAERELTFNQDSQEQRFYLCPICPHGGKIGLFILGPYRSEKKEGSALTYRPQEALPHLVTLLRTLQKEHLKARPREPYCLHVHRAVQMVEKHYNQGISLEHTARSLGLNKSYFSSLFREDTGETFTDFVNLQRVEQSKKLLQESSLSVLEIALEVGFNSQNYYSRGL